MSVREKISSVSVGYFDRQINEATGAKADYLFDRVDQDRAYAEFAVELYGYIIYLIADVGMPADAALEEIENDKERLEEMFNNACMSAEM